jgi:multidrug resistance efflux pump
MIAIATILYVTLIFLIYKILKIRPNPRNVAVMVVLGVLMLGSIVIVWKFSAPMSDRLVASRFTVAIVPQVQGPITKIHAKPQVPLRAGKDLLFEIQSDTYQNTVDQLSESVKAAEQNIAQLGAGAEAAVIGVKKAEADMATAEAAFSVAKNTEKESVGAISKLAVRQATENFRAAEAVVEQAKALAVQAGFGKTAAESSSRSLEAQLATAKFNLSQCKIYAPADGFVTNWAVREGAMAVPMPLSAMGTFVDTSRVHIVAAFPQNLVTNMKPGDAAELTFKTRPGEVFAGKVEAIVQAMAEGQLTLSGKLPSASLIGSPGLMAVKFTLDDEAVAQELALGTAGTVAVYTDSGTAFHVISKVSVRLNAWMYYLIPE